LGGGVLVYRPLAKRLERGQTVFGLQAPGLGDDAPAIATLESMASLYVDEITRARPRGPYRLGGWSMGGWIAFEMARQLEARGDEVDFVGLLDSGAPGTDGAEQAPASHDAQRGVWARRLRRTFENN